MSTSSNVAPTEVTFKCESKGLLGTPFQRTYPSRGKGKRIQLKYRML